MTIIYSMGVVRGTKGISRTTSLQRENKKLEAKSLLTHLTRAKVVQNSLSMSRDMSGSGMCKTIEV